MGKSHHNFTVCRADRTGGGVGTSPGINPLVPYNPAALEYRASWIDGAMMALTNKTDPNREARILRDTLLNEERGMAKFSQTPPPRPQLPPPHEKSRFVESNGMERSLATNIPDHPTAIQVNGLRQERTEGAMCPGYIEGVGSYDARTLTGNWAEDRADKSYVPNQFKGSKGREWMFPTTYQELCKTARAPIPAKGSNADTIYTSGDARFSTGVREESASSNSEIVKLGGVPGIDYAAGDPRSASKKAGNYVNYQCGRQHTIAVLGGRTNNLVPFTTTTSEAFAPPQGKHVPISTERCDNDPSKPFFQLRDPGRDGVAKMMCGIRAGEFACDRTDDHVTTHVVGKTVAGKQKQYTLQAYRERWTKWPEDVKAAGLVDMSEHRARFNGSGFVPKALVSKSNLGKTM